MTTSYPECKINVGLHVVRRRPDGYHDLESIFVPVPLCDELSMEPADAFTFRQTGIPIGGDPEKNLVVRAYRLMEALTPARKQPLAVTLKKNIPFGAGLGGGSSDAAYALVMLNELWGMHLDTNQLRLLAKRLGADCPFFIEHRPAYVTGIGDCIEPLAVDPIAGHRLVVVKPPDAVSTAEAYAGITPRENDTALRQGHSAPFLPDAVRLPLDEWRHTIVNDFETTVFARHPQLADIKQHLYQSGAAYASMSGSGAALFALYPADAEPRLDAHLQSITILNTIIHKES